MQYLMCPPEYYEIAYEINPWMHVEQKADKKLAWAQWQALYDWITGTAGAEVRLLDPVRGLPDLVFTANAGLISGRRFIKSRFRYRQRRAEEIQVERWFRKYDYEVKTVPEPYFFEGEGDALFMGAELYAGYHFRSSLEAFDYVAGLLRRDYCALELQDKRFYHLDTCFSPLDARTALVFLPAFEPYARLTLLEMLPDPVFVSEEEAVRFACNAVIAGRKVALPQGCPGVKAALEKKGFEVWELDFSEFMKSGGAGKCLVLKL